MYLPVAVAADGTVTKWSADTYGTLYVAPNTSVTLKPTCKLESVVSGDTKLNYNAKDGAVSFTVGTEAVQFNSVTVGELVIEKDGFPKGTDGGVPRATAGPLNRTTSMQNCLQTMSPP